MVWFTNWRGVRGRTLAAMFVACPGLAFTGGLAAQAADLDYDQPRYSSSKDYYGDREPEWRPQRSVRRYRDCTPRTFVHEELRADGWRDFHDPRLRGSYVLVDARRAHSGRPFLLTIDRCSGDVIAAEPLAPPRRAYLRSFNDDDRDDDRRWRTYNRGGHGRADWRDDRGWEDEQSASRWADTPRRYRGSY